MESIWEKTSDRIKFDSLSGKRSADVLIIGGGIAGILCAYMLKKSGADCLLVEANRLCGGVTENTTAKITLGHGLIYDKIINLFGEKYADMYLRANLNAMAEYERLCQMTDCDYEKIDSYVYSMSDVSAVNKEISALKKLGVDAELSEAEGLPFSVAGAVRLKDQAQFNPLKFAFSLAKELPIYENTRVVELLPGKAITSDGEISYKKAIVATHFPFLNSHGFYFLKMYQHRSYVLALENADIPDGTYVDASDKGMSFRGYKNLLLLGGGGHRTGKKGGGWRELEEFAGVHYPKSKIVAKWATQDCMTLDGVSYIGRYSGRTPDLYVATGFNKWGMTQSMSAAMILTDIIRGVENENAAVFSPSRSILRPQLAVNAFESLVGLLKPTVQRCTHLGCALKYNPQEHSWDCSCHGSRFTEEGRVIENPATRDKKNMPGKT